MGGGTGPIAIQGGRPSAGAAGGRTPPRVGPGGAPTSAFCFFLAFLGAEEKKQNLRQRRSLRKRKTSRRGGRGARRGPRPAPPPRGANPLPLGPWPRLGRIGGNLGPEEAGGRRRRPPKRPAKGESETPPDCRKRGKLPQKSNLGAGPPQGAFLGGGFGLFGVFSLKKKQKTNGVWGPVRFPGAKWAQRGRGWGQARVPSAKRAQKASFWVGRMPPVQNGLRKWGGWVRHMSPT